MNVDHYHTTNRTATCQRPLFVGARGWPISSMVMVKIYDNGTYSCGQKGLHTWLFYGVKLPKLQAGWTGYGRILPLEK